MPQLGDLSRLTSCVHFDTSESLGLKEATTSDISSTHLQDYGSTRVQPDVPKLGDLSQVLLRLQIRPVTLGDAASDINFPKKHSREASSQGPLDALSAGAVHYKSNKPLLSIYPLRKGQTSDTDFSAGSDVENLRDSDYPVGSDAATPCTTPPTSIDRHALQATDLGKEESGPFASSGLPPKYLSKVRQVLAYQLYKFGPITPIYDEPRTRAQKHKTLSQGLMPLRAQDRLRTAEYPEVERNGIHVFLDMSNINISFQETLRVRYSVDEEARFVPLPSLDLKFLTEILTRGRRVVALNAGCSVPPGKPEPRYVQELRGCGFHVDLRERKQIVTAPNNSLRRQATVATSSSDEQTVVRYVEDLVDETLHTRIAESVMEYFEQQGTIVLATGDAQPAKYSDGFFSYAERALRMGWHVEIVSWKRSLSSFWRRSDWKARWGNRFRIIDLDQFVDELLACAT
ncbi:hypothetical protein HIM_04283 [Hirsutella minnesotensis 3608]|uniref:NYN domain-containing protein n=1 Tax=Hirsutella minnesotensis 3608 TaxID=1043627 RepID=A0A0F7ZLB2_9HYPO|nr:hypothetical protein HIM_04283 [Hirsutella minnesotensis 3608]